MIIGGTRIEEARVFDSERGYHTFQDDDGNTLGTVEVFWYDDGEAEDVEGSAYCAGWYWAAGLPGCLWDGAPNGPFASSIAALADAEVEHGLEY